jgi:hypothetical protein
MFECRILRKIFGPVQNEDGSWRIRMNYELNELIETADRVRFIKSRRIAWLGHVMRMDDRRTPKRILVGLDASRITLSGNYMLRRPKCSKNEVVKTKMFKE